MNYNLYIKLNDRWSLLAEEISLGEAESIMAEHPTWVLWAYELL